MLSVLTNVIRLFKKPGYMSQKWSEANTYLSYSLILTEFSNFNFGTMRLFEMALHKIPCQTLTIYISL